MFDQALWSEGRRQGAGIGHGALPGSFRTVHSDCCDRHTRPARQPPLPHPAGGRRGGDRAGPVPAQRHPRPGHGAGPVPAVAAAVTGTFSLAGAGLDLVLASAGAVAIGLAVGWLGRLVLGQLNDPPVENTVQLLIPFAAYVPADHLGASGVLAVLVAGLYLGRSGPNVITSAARVQGRGLWDILVFILEGLSFLLVGLAIHSVIAGLHGSGWSAPELAGDAALVCGLVMAIRIAWVFPTANLPALLTRWRPPGHPGRQDPPGWRRAAVVAWAGMRGVVSLAAALALPLKTRGGAPFPDRNLLIFLTFCVIVATLVLQGLTLPALIRWLNVAEPAERAAVEEAETRIRMDKAALRRLDELEEDLDLPAEPLDTLRQRYQARLDLLRARHPDNLDDETAALHGTLRTLRQELLAAERTELLHVRDRTGLSPEVFRRISQDLDHEEARTQAPG